MGDFCHQCGRLKADVWRRQDIGKAGRHGLCFLPLAYGPQFHEDDRAFHQAAVKDCREHTVDWRETLFDFVGSQVVQRTDGQWYQHPSGSYGWTTKESAIQALVEEVAKDHRYKRD